MASIMEPIRHFTRVKDRECVVVEGSCTKISPSTKTVVVNDKNGNQAELKYDALVVACGAGYPYSLLINAKRTRHSG